MSGDPIRLSAPEKAKLQTELAAAERAWKTITRLVWADAVCVMLVGLGVVNTLLKANNFPPEIAWLLAPTVDIGLIVGLFGSSDLARHGHRAGMIGALRWVCAFLTWGLNTAPSWMAADGISWPGVALHSVAPVLLFFVTEAAAYYMQTKGKVISELKRRLEQSEAADQAERAERRTLEEQVRRAEAEKIHAVSEAGRLTAELAAIIAERDAERTNADRSTDDLRRDMETLRATLTAASEAAAAAHSEALSALAVKHSEEVARIKAEMSTVSLTDYRKTHPPKAGKKGSAPAPKRVVTSDDDVIAKCFAEHPESGYDWSQAEVTRVGGVGFGRAPRIVSAITDHLSECPTVSHDICFGEGRGDADGSDAERSPLDLADLTSTAIGATA